MDVRVEEARHRIQAVGPSLRLSLNLERRTPTFVAGDCGEAVFLDPYVGLVNLRRENVDEFGAANHEVHWLVSPDGGHDVFTSLSHASPSLCLSNRRTG